MNNNQLPWYCQWWAIVVAFIVFWPAGIALFILRNNQSKQSIFLGTTDKKKYILIGVGLILIGIFYMMRHHGWLGFFMVVGGVALIICAERFKIKSERNRRYIELIVNQGETSLDKIASMCNVQYDVAVKEINYLISMRVLKNARLDNMMRTIEIAKVVSTVINSNNVINQGSPSMSASPRQVVNVTCTCKGCGAKMVLPKGTTALCEYCDNPVNA